MIDAYAPALDEYLKTHSEAALYHASLLSQRCIDSGLGPEDIIALHCEALDQVLNTYPPALDYGPAMMPASSCSRS